MSNISKKTAGLLVMLTMTLAMLVTFSCSSDDTPEKVSCSIAGQCLPDLYTAEQCAIATGTVVPSCGGNSSSLGGGNDVKVPCEIGGVCIADVYTLQVCLQVNGTIVAQCSSVNSSSSNGNNGSDVKVSCEIGGTCIADTYTAQICAQVGIIVGSCPIATPSSSSNPSVNRSSSSKASSNPSSTSIVNRSSSSASFVDGMNCSVSGYCYEIPDAAECIGYGGTPSPCEKMAGCGSYCRWESGCFEIVPDPAAVYGPSYISTCSAAQSNCSSYGLGGPYSNSDCTSSTTPPSGSQYCFYSNRYCDIIGLFSGNLYYFLDAYDCTTYPGTVVTRAWCLTNDYPIRDN